MVEVKRGPFGGFCNYGIFEVEGKDSETGKRKYKKVNAVSEAAALEKAAAAGCVGPYSVKVSPFLDPSDRQQKYAQALGVSFPAGCNSVDASALISRAEREDQVEPDPALVSFAESCGVCFSYLTNEADLVGSMVAQLPLREKAILFAYAVDASAAGARLADPRSSARYPSFCRFADLVAGDPALAKSVEGREAREYLSPGRNTKAYKTAVSCF